MIRLNKKPTECNWLTDIVRMTDRLTEWVSRWHVSWHVLVTRVVRPRLSQCPLSCVNHDRGSSYRTNPHCRRPRVSRRTWTGGGWHGAGDTLCQVRAPLTGWRGVGIGMSSDGHLTPSTGFRRCCGVVRLVTPPPDRSLTSPLGLPTALGKHLPRLKPRGYFPLKIRY